MTELEAVIESMEKINEKARKRMIIKVSSDNLLKAMDKYHYDADGFFEFMKDIYGLKHVTDFAINDIKDGTEFVIYTDTVKSNSKLNKLIKDMDGVAYDEFYNVVQLNGDEPDARNNGDEDDTAGVNPSSTKSIKKKVKKESTDAGSIPSKSGAKIIKKKRIIGN